MLLFYIVALTELQ